jgi:hypothetical protein
MTSSVLRPIEPVDPSTTTFRGEILMPGAAFIQQGKKAASG